MKLLRTRAYPGKGNAGRVKKFQPTQWRSIMMSTRKILAVAVAAAAFAATSAYSADTAAPAPGARDCTYGPGASHGRDHGHGMMGHGPGRGGSGGMWSNPAAMVEGHLAALKVELKITANQESAWKTFTDKARKQSETMIAQREKIFAQKPATDQPAPERLAQRTEFAKQRIANMETMTTAVKDLYGTLTPEQKKIADQLLARGPMGGMGGMGGGRGFRR
jgi:Spy/CpxP family protein refolding chaperone